MESSSLVEELRRYCQMTKLLAKSLNDTRKAFKDVNAAKCMVGSQFVSAEISEVEETAIDTLAGRPPCIVILGQSLEARVAVTNWIFGQDILPSPGKTPWRTVLFRYGQRNKVGLINESNVQKQPSVTLPGMVSGPPKHSRSWKVSIPLDELEVVDDSPAISVDVRANLSLLFTGARVIVGGCRSGDVLESYNQLVSDVIPVIVYVIQNGKLSEEEMSLLRHIHKSEQDMPVYFVHMPNPSENQPPCRNTVTASPCPEQTFPCLERSTSQSTLYRQLVELEFFAEVSSQLSDAGNSRSSSTFDRSLSDTIVAPDTADTLVTSKRLLASSFETDAGCRPPDCSFDDTSIPLPRTSPSFKETEMSDFADVEVVPDKDITQPTLTDSASDVANSQLSSNPTSNSIDSLIRNSAPADRPVSDVDSESCQAAVDSELVEGHFDGFSNKLATFIHNILQIQLLSTVALLHAVHRRCLDLMISTAFDMAWDVMCTPNRLKYTREKESDLYQALMRVAMKKQDEIKQIILDAVSKESDSIVQGAAILKLNGLNGPDSNGEVNEVTVQTVKECTSQIHDYVLTRLNAAISCKLLELVNVLHDNYTGVLTRCLRSLEQKDFESSKSTETSDALKEILNAAYRIDINVSTGASFVKILVEKMRRLMHGSLWHAPSQLDDTWKRKIAISVLATLTEERCQRLAKSICAQIKDRVRASHSLFQTSLQRLEAHHNGRLQKTERQSLEVRKVYAPRIARLALESRSLKDLILYGKPRMGPEIGRGQYGVVYSCQTWANIGRCAVKTVVPPDDRHWNDLAMEFYYTTSIPEHDRLVALRGSIVDYGFGSGGGRSPAVLLIMDRYKCDLYTAIERRMNWLSRLRVSLDVVEGIRYLHAQGLVHRDIKLKNVLLDDDNRGRLTDLGFCKPEAMMSGSIVGTPLHMAPELITGHYDHSVDVYAFGVLFWYVCAGSVRLPSHFEVCLNKEMLFNFVQQGLRPERPQDCDTDCWDLMSRCWSGEPSKRPHVGELEESLREIYDRVLLSRQQAVANGDEIDIDAVYESEAVDSDFDAFDDLTLH